MKSWGWLTCAIIFFTTLCAAQDQTQPVHPAEKISYAIKKYGIPAGEATLEFSGPTLLRNRSALLIRFRATALNFLDQETIYLDPQTYLPIRVERDLNIFGRREKIIESYDQRQGQIRIVKSASGKETEQTIEKDGWIDNIYCFIYRYRKRGVFRIGDNLTLNLPTRNVVISLIGKNQLKTAGRVFEAFFMQSQPKKYRIWFDSSTRKIPLRIDGAVGLGNTSMIMTDYQIVKENL